MKRKIVALALGIIVCLGSTSAVMAIREVPSEKGNTDVNDIKDVKESSYAPYVERVFDLGIMDEVSREEFGVESEINRGDFIVSLYKFAGSPIVEGSLTYTDVISQEYMSATLWAVENKLFEAIKNTEDTKDTEFKEDEKISKEEYAKIMYHFSKNVLHLEMKSNVEILDTFEECKDLSADSKEALSWAIASGLLEEKDGKLDLLVPVNKGILAMGISKVMDLKEEADAAEEKAKLLKAESVKEQAMEEDVKHTHTWRDVYRDIKHEEEGKSFDTLVKDAWVENPEHAAEYTTTYVVITPAWVETVSDGWVCEGCGASI